MSEKFTNKNQDREPEVFDGEFEEVITSHETESKKQQIEEVAKQAGLEESEIETLKTVAMKLALVGRESLRSDQRLFLRLNEDAVRAVIDIEKFGESTEESPEAVAKEVESLSSYLELKRDYKEKKRAYEEALESRSFVKKAFRLGRKNLSPEEQALYDESLEAEKAYYESFLANQKDKIEERLNRNNESGEQLTTIPLLVQRHITKPERERLEAQKVHLSPWLQSILEKVKNNKYAMASAATAGIGLKSLSIMSSFGVGLAAGAGTRWGMNKLIAGREKRLEQKTETFNSLFESGDIDDLADIKDEYFQELRKIDNRKLAANLTAAGVAVTAGTSAHDYFDSAIPADAEGILGEKLGEYWDVAKEKVESLKDSFKEGESWYGDVERDVNQGPDATPAEATEVVENSVAINEAQSEEVETQLTQEEREQATGSLEKALDDTEEALGNTIGVPNEVDAELTETKTPEASAETGELSPEMQEKLDNMRAVQDAQDRAQEMVNSEVATEKYKIQDGDTLSEIAEANDVSIKELMEANLEITDPHKITAGQEIYIPEATGSPVYDEGVGLGGPGSEGSEPGVSTENAEVPDYSGTEATAEEMSSDQVTNEAVPSRESVTSVPREVDTAEIVRHQTELKESLQAGVREVGGLPSTDLLFKFDHTSGYEPLYTPDLLDRTLVVNNTADSSQLYGHLALDMISAYQEGQINLPAQWVYILDTLEDGYYGDFMKEGQIGDFQNSPDSITVWNSEKYTLLREQLAKDIQSTELSKSEIKSFGISSGNIDELREGDRIQSGEIIKRMIQNMAERINDGAQSTSGPSAQSISA